MLWKNFEYLFHESWHSRIRPFIESSECDKIYEFLKFESQRGKKISPLSSNVWRCFLETPFDELKLILCGFSPYHTFKNNLPVADGLLMSCSVTNYPQLSLFQWYQAIENELYDGINLNYIKNPDLLFLAKQGVLLLNSSLTVEYMKAGSHNLLWEPFMKYLFEEVLSGTGVPVVFLGKESAKLEKYVAPFTWVFKVSHPASASYSGTEWDAEELFKKINKVLMDQNGYKIDWLDIDNLPF